MIFKINELKASEIYHLIAQTVIPRPIAWIVTEDDGVINIAPFSFFTPLSSSPATAIVSIGHKSDGSPKDTLANILKNKKCTICMVDDYHLEKMHLSSKSLDKDESESILFDIKTTMHVEEFPPMIENASVAYSCSLNQIVDLGESKTIPVIVNIENIFVDDKALESNEKPIVNFNPVARVAREYALLGEKIKAPKIP